MHHEDQGDTGDNCKDCGPNDDTDAGPPVGKRANQELKAENAKDAGAQHPVGGLKGTAGAQAKNGEEGNEHGVAQRGGANSKEEQWRALDDTQKVSAFLVVKNVVADIHQREGKDAEPQTGYSDEPRQPALRSGKGPVSYTHLTLPTIYPV